MLLIRSDSCGFCGLRNTLWETLITRKLARSTRSYVQKFKLQKRLNHSVESMQGLKLDYVLEIEEVTSILESISELKEKRSTGLDSCG